VAIFTIVVVAEISVVTVVVRAMGICATPLIVVIHATPVVVRAIIVLAVIAAVGDVIGLFVMIRVGRIAIRNMTRPGREITVALFIVATFLPPVVFAIVMSIFI